MKTRKQKSPVSRRARHQTKKHGPARSRPTAARGKAAAAGGEAAGARGKAAAARRGRPGRRPRGDAALTLAADCTVAEADALKSALVSRLGESDPVTVDVTALQRIDTSGLQLLAAFVRDRRTAGRAVAWRGRAPALETAAQLLGLHHMLELPGEAGR